MSNVAALHGGVYDQEKEDWAIVATNEPNHAGNYFAHLTIGGGLVSDSMRCSQSRSDAIKACRSFAEWYKTHDPSTETIPL